ncbi:MAG TPA: tRNA (adenosine(37)-N6)-dimethylallyltransferase MiaA [Devosiaceae bacterium]
MAGDRRAVLIAGPTASGKSAHALTLARQSGAPIINADSMQVYSVLRVLTARPGPGDLVAAQHMLYGYVDPSVRFSTGQWAADVGRLLAGELAKAETVIFAGGTGLYFEALTKGFASVPEVPDEVVARIDRQVAALDREGRGRLLAARDPAMARRIREPDPQRVTRALAVLEATGKSLAEYQQADQPALLQGFEIEKYVIDPGREISNERIARRFKAMLEEGAVEEVRDLLARNLDPSLPAMKAIGVREIALWLEGKMSAGEVVERTIIATRQYAKRQRTWFRNRMGDWTWISG